MSSHKEHQDERAYVERGIQTEPSPNAAQYNTSGIPLTLESNNCDCFCHGKRQISANPDVGELHVQKIGGDKPSAIARPSQLPRIPQRASNRVVSLPELGESRDGPAIIQPRVVSLPGFLRDLSPESDEDPLDAFSFDSGSGDPFSLGDYLGSRNGAPVCLPRTPPPPPDFGQDNWALWTTSPPKPIPALHGPLSLPYARCPSGAEGTIIEGDQPSTMIWGLDPVEHSQAGSGEAPLGQESRHPQTQMGSFPYRRHQRERPNLASGAQDHPSWNRPTVIGITRQMETVSVQNQRSSQSSSDSSSALPRTVMRNPRESAEALAGLGIGSEVNTRRLKQLQYAALGRSPQQLVSSFSPFQTQNPFEIPAPEVIPDRISVRQSLRDHYESPTFLTPPLTVSPWTPQLPLTPGTPLTPDIDVAFAGQKPVTLGLLQLQSLASVGNEYSPVVHSQEFLNVQFQFSKDHDVPSDPPKPATSNAPHSLSRHQRLASLFEGSFPTTSTRRIGPVENKLANHRRSLSVQEPRSVPLARLLQKQLATVLEEDHGPIARGSSVRYSRNPPSSAGLPSRGQPRVAGGDRSSHLDVRQSENPEQSNRATRGLHGKSSPGLDTFSISN
ncbi:hypothetical protein CC1G_04540 [Coprinopsis cinerea okayama7|uniref:Uncharacterized protein n=1 Tax=Coprinopsis cinerea (strain Okayama-7 / 130 / ATCC MYA-4618 / FGSC 9003) TaxID=240176 RepID=A8N5G2_COPC7|nr:hypothetical protein CC1G_04540 [Coprinopsis cinerea okayama7\|eukprot:XP_001830107.2 hypothetical protein CC1G_04540 [Coprinopsis cinerea okayama7\